MRTALVALWAAVSAACAHGGSAAAAAAAVPPPPKFFAPLGWGTNAESLREAFPKANVDETSYPGQSGADVTAITAGGIEWREMGTVHVSIVGRPKEPASMIEVGTDDVRPECNAMQAGRPRTCRNRFGPQLVKIWEAVERAVSSELGKPKALHPGLSEAHGLPPDKNERLVRWTTPTQKVDLALGPGEFGDWSVSLVVVRIGAPM